MRGPRFLMSLESCDCRFDVVLFGFYDVLENALGLWFPGSAIFLIESRDGGFRELEPYLHQNFDHGCMRLTVVAHRLKLARKW